MTISTLGTGNGAGRSASKINVLLIVGFLLAMSANAVSKENMLPLVPSGFLIVTLLTRFGVRRLPEFLR